MFRAPRDGVYVFFCRITGTENPSDMVFEFIMNGLAKTRNLLIAKSPTPYRTSSSSIVLSLNHGDKVWIKMALGGYHFNAGVGGYQTYSPVISFDCDFFYSKKCINIYTSHIIYFMYSSCILVLWIYLCEYYKNMRSNMNIEISELTFWSNYWNVNTIYIKLKSLISLQVMSNLLFFILGYLEFLSNKYLST